MPHTGAHRRKQSVRSGKPETAPRGEVNEAVYRPAAFPDVYREIGAPKEGLEEIQEYGQAVFWSFSQKDYQKTNWWPKTAAAPVGSKLTIRMANTVRKVVEM